MLKLKTKNKCHQAILMGFLSLTFSSVYADEKSVETTIKAVTVYPGSAKVMRVSDIELPAGETELIIRNLPLNLNEKSLRVSGDSDGKVSIGSVEFSRDIQKDVVQAEEKKIRDQIEELNEQKKVIEDSITRNNAQLEYIRKMVLGNTINVRKEESKNGSYSNLPLEQWEHAWKTLDEGTKRAQEEIRLSNKALKENNKELNKLARELQQVATYQKAFRNAKIKVLSDSTANLSLNLAYQINGARWEPVYDVDLNTESGELEMKTLAQISQRTGEDWKNVDITLSTLRPNAGTQLPQLNPWVLDFMPEMVAMSSSMDQMSGVAMDSMERKEVVQEFRAAAKKTRVQRSKVIQEQSRLISADFSAEYKVPNRISLGSGSNKRRFALNSTKLSSSIKLASSPRFDPRVMILATSKHTQETPLLAGSMSLYRNGNYVGNAYLQQKQSGEEIKLSFGEDDKVKIKFMPDPDKKSKDGLLFGKKKVVERHYKISINSNHSKVYPITISDVIPVASNEEIKIKRLGEAPTRVDVDDKKGVIEWDKSLTSGKEIKINYGYSVSYPEDKEIPRL